MRATLIIPGEKITAKDVEVEFVAPSPPGGGKAGGFLTVPYSLYEMFHRRLPAVLVVEDVGRFGVEIAARQGRGGGKVKGTFAVISHPSGWSPP
jgi:hypothetical protein